MQFDSEQLAWATEVVRRRVPPTPQYPWPLLAEAVGAEVWVKHENHTPTGAFKVRGGVIYAERLRAGRPQVKGIISATRGNNGQSLAFAGTAVGVSVTIVVPEGNNPDKNAAMRAFGAELIVKGHDFQAAREHATVVAGERRLEMVPPPPPGPGARRRRLRRRVVRCRRGTGRRIRPGRSRFRNRNGSVDPSRPKRAWVTLRWAR